MAMSPKQRQAQRVLIGLVNRGGHTGLDRDEKLVFWREDGSEAWQAGASEIAMHLRTLGVPHSVLRARWTRGQNKGRLGTQIEIAWRDLGKLEQWVPSVRKLIVAVEAGD